MTLDKLRELMDLNLTSCMLCTRWIGAAMIERGQGGRIINVSSINALVAGRGIGELPPPRAVHSYMTFYDARELGVGTVNRIVRRRRSTSPPAMR